MAKILYSIRNLDYTLPRLLLVCTMMLLANKTLGLICYTLVPSVKPILLDRVGASATDIALIISTIPSVLTFVLCPLISTISDKTRTRIGRRQPYLIFSAPILAGLLMLLAWSVEIAEFIKKLLPSLANTNVSFYVVATIILLFQVVYLFPGSVVYYLIADVIPKECIGRFMAASTISGSIVSAAFNYWVLGYVIDYMKLIFCIMGVLYVAIYVGILIFVPEGEYPPVADKIDKTENFWVKSKDYLWMFFRQCFQHRIFILLFLCIGMNQASNVCRAMYNVLFATKDIGMTMAQYGKVIAIGSIISAVLAYFLGKLMDKTHPIFIYFIGGIFVICINIFGYFFVYTPMTFAVIGVATAIMYAVQNLAQSPLLINLLPPDKYGQFASANSMVCSTIMIFAAYLGGKLTDIFGYRVMFVWDIVITIIATVVLFGVYREWQRHGGKKGYKSPEII